MKKIITLGALFSFSLSALTLSMPVEAKRGGFSSSPVRSAPAVRKPSTQQKTQQNSQQQKDADFNNTPPKQAMPNNAAAQPQGNRLANFATGAMAGYLLSDMLSPSEAQAQQQTGQGTTEPMQQLTEQVKQTPAAPQIPAFKSIDANDPFLIEKTAGYMRYCLNGVQYLISTANTQLPPTLMVDRTNAPAQCVIVP